MNNVKRGKKGITFRREEKLKVIFHDMTVNLMEYNISFYNLKEIPMHPVVLCMSPQAKIEMGAFNQGHINQKSSTVVKWQNELRQFSLLQFDDFIKYDFSINIFSSNACQSLFCEIRLRMCHTPDLFPT